VAGAFFRSSQESIFSGTVLDNKVRKAGMAFNKEAK